MSRLKAHAEWAVFLVLALLAISPAFKSGHVVGDGVDLYGTLWFYWWIEDCLFALRDPGFTTHFFFPLGKDIFAHTGNNFVDAVVALPFMWLFGNPGYQRWYVLAVLLANVASFRVLARGLFTDRAVVFASSLAYAVSPYILFEITAGRLTQAFLVFSPLALHHLLKTESSSSWKHPVLAGLFTALQGWTYWFMGWFLAFAFVPLGIAALARSKDRKRLLLRYLVAGGTCLVAVAPAAIAIAAAASSGEVPGLNQNEVDLFSSPDMLQNNVGTALHGLVMFEQNGPPMLVSWVWLPVTLASMVAAPRFRAAFVVVLLMSLGPVFFSPWTEGNFVLPWYMAAYHYLPYFDRLWFPYRMLSVLFLLVCVAFGYLAQLLWRRRPNAVWVGLAVLVLGTIAEQNRWRILPFVTRDATLPRVMEQVRDEGGYLIHLPLGVNQPSIIWQTFHEQPMFGGMGENAPLLQPEGFRQRLQNSFIRTLLESTRRPSHKRTYSSKQRERIEEEGFRWVVLNRDLVESEAIRVSRVELDDVETANWAIRGTRRLVEVLGEPTAVEGTYVTWDLTGDAATPAGLEPTPENLYTKVWETPPPPAYEAALRESGRLEDRRP